MMLPQGSADDDKKPEPKPKRRSRKKQGNEEMEDAEDEVTANEDEGDDGMMTSPRLMKRMGQ